MTILKVKKKKKLLALTHGGNNKLYMLVKKY